VKFLVNDPSFVALSNVNFTKSGNVLISDFSGSRPLRELDPTTGAVVKEFGAGYARHEDVIVDGDDNVFVSAYDRGSILKFDAMRNLVDEYKPEGLTNPTGIVLTPDCRLLVSSFGTSQLYELTFAGTLIKAHTITGLSAPESISLSGVTLAGSIGLVVATPRCGPKPDAGADAEADATSPDADVLDTAVVDAASDTKDASDTADAGKPVAPVADESGCGCTMVGAPTNGASEIAALLASFVALCRTRRRR
jgi:MYXO-CTERM domain-containing protein